MAEDARTWTSPREASAFQGGWFGVPHEQPACHSPPALPSHADGLLKAHHCHLGWFHGVAPHDERNVVQELHFFLPAVMRHLSQAELGPSAACQPQPQAFPLPRQRCGFQAEGAVQDHWLFTPSSKKGSAMDNMALYAQPHCPFPLGKKKKKPQNSSDGTGAIPHCFLGRRAFAFSCFKALKLARCSLWSAAQLSHWFCLKTHIDLAQNTSKSDKPELCTCGAVGCRLSGSDYKGCSSGVCKRPQMSKLCLPYLG